MSVELQTNPFIGGSTPDTEDKSLYELVRLAILNAQMDLHTWLPCEVTKVYDDGFVDLQPLLKRVYQDGTEIVLPQAQHVMVCVPRGTDYYLSVPVAVGDTGVGLFCERSLDVWSVQGGQVDPLDSRIHDLSDPVFIPGIFPVSDPIPGAGGTDMALNNGGTTFTLQKSGKMKFAGAAGQDVLSILSDAITQCASLATATGNLPIAAAFGLIQARLALIKG